MGVTELVPPGGSSLCLSTQGKQIDGERIGPERSPDKQVSKAIPPRCFLKGMRASMILGISQAK